MVVVVMGWELNITLVGQYDECIEITLIDSGYVQSRRGGYHSQPARTAKLSAESLELARLTVNTLRHYRPQPQQNDGRMTGQQSNAATDVGNSYELSVVLSDDGRKRRYSVHGPFVTEPWQQLANMCRKLG